MAEEPTVETEKNEPTEIEKLEAHYKDLLNKATADAAAHKRNAAEFKAKYESTLTDQQKADALREESDKALREELASLKREKEISDYRAVFLGASLSDDTAKSLAASLADGDKDGFIKAFSAMAEELKKAYKLASYKNSPKPDGNNGEDDKDDGVAFASKLGEKRAESNKLSTDILKKYK